MKKSLKKLRATTTFKKKTAVRLTDMSYYVAQGKDRKHLYRKPKAFYSRHPKGALEFINYEKTRLSTVQLSKAKGFRFKATFGCLREKVTDLIEFYKNKAFSKESSLGKILKGIYNKQKQQIIKREPLKKINNVISILAKPETPPLTDIEAVCCGTYMSKLENLNKLAESTRLKGLLEQDMSDRRKDIKSR